MIEGSCAVDSHINFIVRVSIVFLSTTVTHYYMSASRVTEYHCSFDKYDYTILLRCFLALPATTAVVETCTSPGLHYALYPYCCRAIKKPLTAVKKKRLEAASMASGAHCASGNDSVAYNSDDDLKPFAKLPGEAFVEPPSPEDKSAKRVLKSMIKREYAYGKPSSDKIKKDAAKRQPTAKK